MQELLVSVVIVNYNGIEFIDQCLGSVFNSAYKNIEVIFVDNGSSDGSLERVKVRFINEPRLRIVENKASLGPAVGRNRGVKVSGGKYLFFLDNDTKIAPNCINELVKVLEEDISVGAAQAKLLRMDSDNLYDCAGDYLGPLGFLIERSKGVRDTGQFDFITEILSAKSAASIIRKDLFQQISGFDEDFYMYLEETDLSWRVWLSGSRVVFIPSAVVYHAFNTKKKEFRKYYSRYVVRYYGCRNYITTILKNVELKNLFAILPLHICAWLVISLLFFLSGKILDWFYILKGIWWNFLNIGIIAANHQSINRNIRKVDDKAIFERVKTKEDISNYLRKTIIYLKTRL